MKKKYIEFLNKNKTTYPQLTLRLSQENLDEINQKLSLIEAKLSIIAENENSKALKRNQILTKILLEGLDMLNNDLPKLKRKK